MDKMEEKVEDDKLKVYLRLNGSAGVNTIYNCITSRELETEAPKESVSYKNYSNGVGKLVHKFTFTEIFNDTASQRSTFEKCAVSNLKRFLSGENYLLMAYGTAGGGKTYTIQGTIEDPGVLPRAIEFVFNSLRDKIEPSCKYQPYRSNEFQYFSKEQMEKELNFKNFILTLDLAKYQRHPETSYMTYKSETMLSASSSGFYEGYENTTFREMQERLSNEETYKVSSHRFCVWISMVEIYNEQVYDLLEVPDEKGGRMKLNYGEDESGNVFIKNLRHVNVGSGHEAFQVLQFGRTNLHLAPTALNSSSSRSHCICTLTIARLLDEKKAVVSKFSFCDLAGIERAKKTLNLGDRLDESKSINTSLLILVKCLTTIKENQSSKDKKMIPFRESKLTRLFKDAMIGKEKFSMIVNVTTEPNLFDETLNVLKFSAIAQQIEPKNVFVKPRTVRSAGKSRFSRLVVESNDNLNLIDWDTSVVVLEESRVQSNQDYTKLLNLNDELKRSLAEEKEKNENLEIKIREELTSKFSEMLKQQRERNESRLVNATKRLEEQFDWKEKKLLEHLKKLDKKRKLEDGEIDVEKEDLAREKEKQFLAMEKDLEFLTAENNSLREQISSIGEENNNLQASVTQMRFELAEKSRILDQLEKQLKSSEAGTDAHVKVLQEQLEKAVAKNSEFKELLDDAAYEHKELLESNQFLKDENESIEKDLASKSEAVEDLKSELGELQELLEMKKEEFEDLENKEREAAEELNKMTEKLKEINKSKEDEINEKNLEIDTLQKEVKQLTLRIQEAMEEAKLPLEGLRTENENLREEIDGLKNEKLELEKLKAEEIRNYKLEMGNLEKELEEFKNVQLEFDKLQKEVEDLKNDKLELEKKLQEKSPNDELREANESLEREVEKLIKEKLELERKLEKQLVNEGLGLEIENVCVKPTRIRPAGESRFSRLVVESKDNSNMIDWDTSTVVDEESRVQNNQAYTDLLNLVDELKRNLAEEKEKNENIEMEIREELTSKFSEMLKQQRERNESRLENVTKGLKEQFDRKEKRLLDYLTKLDRLAKKRKLEGEVVDVEKEDLAREKEKKFLAMEKDLEFLTAENNSLKEQISSIGGE